MAQNTFLVPGHMKIGANAMQNVHVKTVPITGVGYVI